MKFLILVGGIVIVSLCITGVVYLIKNLRFKDNEKNGDDE